VNEESRGPREFDLIDRIRRRAASRDDVVLGIGDDAAVLQVPAGMQLVVAMDTLNIGVHFPHDTAPAHIGWKALAVNLSDLAAMGAVPAWCTLSLSLPDARREWLDGFLDGFLALAQQHDVALVGGDTTRGPLSISVTVHGFVASDAALRRSGARDGDDIWVSGTLGDAAAGLAIVQAHETPRREIASAISQAHDDANELIARLDRPTPRLALGRALVGLAHACIDVSDGLIADLGHIADASGLGAEVNVETLPVSDALGSSTTGDMRRALQCSGGDDYELCFTAPVANRAAIEQAAFIGATAVTRIGRMHVGQGVEAVDAAGRPWLTARGFEHFA